MTSETWSRQSALDALHEQRRRQGPDARLDALDSVAAVLADRLTQYTDVAPADSATVLLVAGASVGALALTHELPAIMLAEILQSAAVKLDQRAEGGEAP
ncbi:hypothetical protein [Streptomyces sp. G1]|uniref:hypothetical protein n=1 Tax=Streptomyces sp. G1 TaxID=361572 RepID=UPI00202F37A2|nr:hypothetical protein [Streptomyces sp. G1]MCM1977187.1 hypothetical protein [Streptomyces sp. G1]